LYLTCNGKRDIHADSVRWRKTNLNDTCPLASVRLRSEFRAVADVGGAFFAISLSHYLTERTFNIVEMDG